jgi:PAS domain-containing protein
MVFDPLLAGGFLVTGVFSAALGLLLLALLQKKTRRGPAALFFENSGSAEYLFDGKTLIDATPAGRSLLPKACQHNPAVWPGLISYMEQHFPGVTPRLETLLHDGTLMMSSVDEAEADPLLLRAEVRGGLTRISILDGQSATSSRALDPLTRRAIRDELETLRRLTAKAPLPIWRESARGDVIWANAAYLDIVTERLGDEEDLTWPLPHLFKPVQTLDASKVSRQKLGVQTDQKDRWFDLFIAEEEGGQQVYALPADSAVKAEEGLRAFMQTLTKTFAHLSTGLAIFDQDRKLVLFNPALIDLTGLSPDLLTKRPALAMFFDALRENAMIPEPRDYRSWRNQITDIEEAAATGHYEEMWSLSSGQTYRVIGRPYPNGALALSFEDISTEMSQTRRYRADLELGQAVIDAVDEAIAVFSATGILVMSNAAYASLWGHDPGASFSAEGGASALCGFWRDATAPTTLWDRAEDFLALLGPRQAWSDEARLPDGRRLSCRFSPLAGGATLAAFRISAAEQEGDGPTFSSARKRVG